MEKTKVKKQKCKNQSGPLSEKEKINFSTKINLKEDLLYKELQLILNL